jgi:hypothetical protein
MGRYGTPGQVKPPEKLYRILIAPHQVDMSKEAILLTAVSHTEVMGMSVLRDNASREEFHKISQELLADDPKRSIFGVAELTCGDIRDLKNSLGSPRRQKDDRHFIVLDTDLPNLPHHADVFSTFPRVSVDTKAPTNKAIWRKERAKLFEMAQDNVIKAADFAHLA